MLASLEKITGIPERHMPLVFFILAVSVGWLLGHSLPQARWALHHQIYADNKTTVGLCLVLAIVYGTCMRPSPHKRLFRRAGFILLLVGLLTHREFWAWWRWYLGREDLVTANYLRDDLAWMTSFSQLSIWIGLGLILTAYVHRYYGRRSYCLVAAGVVGYWSLWFLISVGTK